MEKRGEITTEGVIKMFFAVVGLIILMYVGAKVVGILINNNEAERAQASLDRIIDAVEKAEIKQEDVDFFLQSPNGWWVIAWPYQDWESDQGETKPISCEGDNCICLCPIPSAVSKESSFEECSLKGICESYEKKVKTIYAAEVQSIPASIVKWFADLFGKDTTNIPLDIEGVLPLRVSLNEEEIHIIKRDI